jgi:DNA end-binding protein Ku
VCQESGSNPARPREYSERIGQAVDAVANPAHSKAFSLDKCAGGDSMEVPGPVCAVRGNDRLISRRIPVMARYSSWKGYLKISLVSVPVKAYTAANNTAKISLNQLHAGCNSRINYKKTCPAHGEVPSSEIVSGYEYTKGQYVVIDTDELEKLRTEKDRSLDIKKFVPADTIDSLYQSGKTYYLLPDGPVGQKPYQLIHDVMKSQGVHAVARVVLSKKEELVVIRPIDKLLVMTVLNYAAEVKEPQSFYDELVESAGTKEEIQLTTQLIDALTTSEFDLDEYKDVYTEKLTQLIESKVEGKELVAVAGGDEPQVINLMDAITQSMKQIKVPGAAEKPPRKAAASKTEREPAAAKKAAPKKRKSG